MDYDNEEIKEIIIQGINKRFEINLKIIGLYFSNFDNRTSISGLMVKFPLAMRELRVRFPADAFCFDYTFLIL